MYVKLICISAVSLQEFYYSCRKTFKNRSSEFLILNALLFTFSLCCSGAFAPKYYKMVYPYLANTVPALEVSTHSGWPVLITVLIRLALACGFTSCTLVASVLIDQSREKPLTLRARGLSKLSRTCATHKPLAAIV